MFKNFETSHWHTPNLPSAFRCLNTFKLCIPVAKNIIQQHQQKAGSEGFYGTCFRRRVQFKSSAGSPQIERNVRKYEMPAFDNRIMAPSLYTTVLIIFDSCFAELRNTKYMTSLHTSQVSNAIFTPGFIRTNLVSQHP